MRKILALLGLGIACTMGGTGWMLSAPPSFPIAISFNPTNPSILDNVPVGMEVAAVSVMMSDGSTFPGTISSSDPQFTTSGMTVITAVSPLTDGLHNDTITATMPSSVVSGGSGLASGTYSISTGGACVDDAIFNNIVLANCNGSSTQKYAWNGTAMGGLFDVNSGTNPDPVGSNGDNKGNSGDSLTIKAVSGGFTIFDTQTSHYLQGSPFGFGATQTVWTIQ